MEIPRHWRLRKQRYSLIGERDSQTDGVSFPPGLNSPQYNPETGESLNGKHHGEKPLEVDKTVVYNAEINV